MSGKVLQERPFCCLVFATLFTVVFAGSAIAESSPASNSSTSSSSTDSAGYYLRCATEYRRKGLIALAIVHVNKALQLDPSLNEAARVRDEWLRTSWTRMDPQRNQADENEIRQILDLEVSTANSHDLDSCFRLYADDYLNSDGFDKKESREILENFLEMYPDARTELSIDSISTYGSLAACSVLEKTTAISGREMPGLGKGTLTSTYRRVRYLRKEKNASWKFIAASSGAEDVSVIFGDGLSCVPKLDSQTKGEDVVHIDAVLTCKLGADQSALGSISSQAETFPAQQPKDGWRPMEDCRLERIMTPNKINRNELITATIGVSNRKLRSLTGLVLLTRKINLLPESSVVVAKM
jgi:hypothetical protein